MRYAFRHALFIAEYILYAMRLGSIQYITQKIPSPALFCEKAFDGMQGRWTRIESHAMIMDKACQ